MTTTLAGKSLDGCREAFEKWAFENHYGTSRCSQTGFYNSNETAWAWDAWLAGTAWNTRHQGDAKVVLEPPDNISKYLKWAPHMSECYSLHGNDEICDCGLLDLRCNVEVLYER